MCLRRALATTKELLTLWISLSQLICHTGFMLILATAATEVEGSGDGPYLYQVTFTYTVEDLDYKDDQGPRQDGGRATQVE